MDFFDAYSRPERRTPRSKPKARGGLRARHFGDFECRHCRAAVSADPARSGVVHRNHCPNCLWSRHMDLHVAGDRLSACKGSMAPVGLTLKQVNKRYGGSQLGELMLAHQCAACGALSANRVAADDSAAGLWAVFEESLARPPAARPAGITLLAAADQALARARVFGAAELQPPPTPATLTAG